MMTLTTRAWTGLLFAGVMSMGCSTPSMFSKANNNLPALPTKQALATNPNSGQPNTATKASTPQYPNNAPGLPNMPGAQLTSTANQMPPAGTGLSIPGAPVTVQQAKLDLPAVNGPSPYGNATVNNGIRLPDGVTRNSMPMPAPALAPMPPTPTLPQPQPPSMDMPPAPAPVPSMGMPPPSPLPPVGAVPTPISQPVPVTAPPPPVSLPPIKARPAD